MSCEESMSLESATQRRMCSTTLTFIGAPFISSVMGNALVTISNSKLGNSSRIMVVSAESRIRLASNVNTWSINDEVVR